MLLPIIKSFNWIDILVIILIIRISYISVSQGFFIEFFKLLGTFFSLFICLHYYTTIGNTLDSLFNIKPITIDIWDFLSFFILWIAGGILFWLVREVFLRLVKLEVVSFINRWVSLLLGIGRGFIFVSMLMFLFSIPAVSYLKKSVQRSYLGSRIFFVAPSFYKGIFNGLVLKFMPEQKLNSAVLEIEKDLE